MLPRAAILDVAGQVPQEVVQQLLAACRLGSFSRLQQVVSDIIAEGYAAQQVLLQLQEEVLAAPGPAAEEPAQGNPAQQQQRGRQQAISGTQRAVICEALAVADKCLVDGADEFVQLLNVGAQVLKALGG